MPRDHDEQLLTARLVTSRHPGRWVSVAVVLLLFAMGVHTVITNPRFQWGVVGDYLFHGLVLDGFHGLVLDGLVLTLWLTAAVMTCGFLLGIGLAAMRLSSNYILRTLSFGYVWLANGKIDLSFGPTLSLKYDALHIAGTKFLGQISSTPVGFVTDKGSPIAKALSDAVNALIANGDYAKIFAKIFAKMGVAGSNEIITSTLNPAPTF